MDSIQCFHKHIFNLITLINNLANIKKKKKAMVMQIIFSFMQLSMHLMKDQVVNRD